MHVLRAVDTGTDRDVVFPEEVDEFVIHQGGVRLHSDGGVGITLDDLATLPKQIVPNQQRFPAVEGDVRVLPAERDIDGDNLLNEFPKSFVQKLVEIAANLFYREHFPAMYRFFKAVFAPQIAFRGT